MPIIRFRGLHMYRAITSGIQCSPTLKSFVTQVWCMSFSSIHGMKRILMYSRPKGRGFEPHWRHCIVSLSKNFNPSLVLVQPRKTRSFKTERLLIGRKESNQTKNKNLNASNFCFSPPFMMIIIGSFMQWQK